MRRKALLTILLGIAMASSVVAQETPKKKKRPAPGPFSWVSPMPKKAKLPSGLQHGTFKSASMGIDVGYYIYLPPGYEEAKDVSFPVVYHLHGGRPGAEKKSIKLSPFVDKAIADGKIEPTIYVFPNGGPMSWYDMPNRKNSLGETIFVEELIPHIDATYRTKGKAGRGIEGFSQGGRGTTRIMFKHPELFASAAPGGSGYEPEKRIQENDGYESEKVRFLPIGYNTWDLAEKFAKRENRPVLPIMLWVGTKGFNYEFNLKYSEYLKGLGIEHEMLITEGVDHSAVRFYEKRGIELMQFHQRNFATASKN